MPKAGFLVNMPKAGIPVNMPKAGFPVDMPKAGFGDSNNGNTARRTFKNSEVFFEITQINFEIFKNLHNVLITIRGTGK